MIRLAQVMVRWRKILRTAMNLRVKGGKFLHDICEYQVPCKNSTSGKWSIIIIIIIIILSK
jgi:hypothetical protein